MGVRADLNVSLDGYSIAQTARVLPDLVERDLRRLSPSETTTEYEPDDIPRSIHQIS